MKTTNVLAIVLLGSLLAASVAQGGIIHRYSFSEAPGTTNVADSVGGANGVLRGVGADFDGAGQLVLPGGVTSATDPPAGYVDLPNHMFNILTNVTIETWTTWNGAGNWQRIFDFGTSAGGENVVDGNGAYLFLTTQGPNFIRFAVRDPVTGTEFTQCTGPAIQETGVEVCLTAVYDYTKNLSALYSNGVLIASSVAPVALSTINDVNNWLGRSQWNDNMYAGSYNELRVYDVALNNMEVLSSYMAGVANPSTDISSLGALQAVHMIVTKTNLLEGDTQETYATVDYAKAAGLSLAGVQGVTYGSDTPAVATVNAQGKITAVSSGTAKITLSYQGKTDSATITVARRQQGLANAGTLYVDLRANGLSADAMTWTNRATAGGGDFYAEGTVSYVANVENTGLPGIKFNRAEAFVGPVTTADLEGSSDRSVEVWVYNPFIQQDETVVAWSHRGGPNGSNMSFSYGGNATWGAVAAWGSGGWDLPWGPSGVYPERGRWHYLAYTYDGVRLRAYADGVFMNGQNETLATYAGFPIRIAAQANTDGSGTDLGQAFSGYVAAVRVHGGTLSDNDIKNNYLYGMELTDPGALNGISLNFDASPLAGIGTQTKARVTANYANRNYLAVTTQSTFTSSDPNIATVNPTNGLVTAVAGGNVTITASYNGKTASQTLQVQAATPAAQLVHRYSFSDAVGSTIAKDSVGTADGQIKGTDAAFDGAGQLTLPGATTSATDPPSGYVDLPNGIISALTNATFEAWVTWSSTATLAWQRIFDFGSSDQGEDISSGNGNYLFLCPAVNVSGSVRFAVRDPALDAEPGSEVLNSSASLPKDVESYVAVVYNYGANVSTVYTNGLVAATGAAFTELKTITDVNNWLGRSQWNDGMFGGKFNEFRIWSGVLTPDQITAHMAAGPNTIPVVVPKPPLTATRQGSNLIVTWPGSATGYTPESTPTLGTGASWTTVPGTPTLVNGQYQITVPIGAANQFIRLKK